MFEDKKEILKNNIKESYKEIKKSSTGYYKSKEEYKKYIEEEKIRVKEIEERIKSRYKYQVALANMELLEKTTEKISNTYKKLTKKK